ncbi:hypothetical protein [Tropicimonas sp.]|uniref:hypothetical protein n=1 Tax=Tropicimonas sp. TaxID=2067044 RepID=UPI003A8630C3
MKPWIGRVVATAALCGGAAPCPALTPAGVWKDLTGALARQELTVSAASESETAQRLTISDIVLSARKPGFSLSARIGTLTLSATADGSVSITLDPEIPVDLTQTLSSGEKLDATVVVSHSGTGVSVTEENGETRVDLRTDTLEATGRSFRGDDRSLPVRAQVALRDFSASRTWSALPYAEVTEEASAATLALSVDAGAASGPGGLSARIAIGDLAASATQSGPAAEARGDLGTLLRQGMASQGSARFGPTEFSLDIRGDRAEISASGHLSGGENALSLTPARMLYEVTYSGLDLALAGSGLPMPKASFSLGKARLRAAAPSQQGIAPASIEMRIEFEALAAGEDFWKQFDPEALLPRDPVTLIVEIGGAARWLVDIFDVAAVAARARAGRSPAEVSALRIDRFALSALGAELSGSGAATAATAMPGTPPRAVGQASFRLAGGMALLDRLVALALVSERQAEALRTAAGLLTRPGEGEDVLTTRIERLPGSALTVNGSPVPFPAPVPGESPGNSSTRNETTP